MFGSIATEVTHAGDGGTKGHLLSVTYDHPLPQQVDCYKDTRHP